MIITHTTSFPQGNLQEKRAPDTANRKTSTSINGKRKIKKQKKNTERKK